MKSIRPTYKESCFSAVLFHTRVIQSRLFSAGCGRRACFLCFFAEIPKIRLFNPPKKWYDKSVCAWRLRADAAGWPNAPLGRRVSL